MQGKANLLVFGVSLLVVWLILSAIFPQVTSITTIGIIGIVSAVLITAGVLALLKAFKVFNVFPYKATFLNAGALIVVGLLLGGLFVVPGLPSFSGTLAPSSTATPITSVTPGQVSSASECDASVSPEIRGTSATITLNCYDLEANSPFGSAVDCGTVQIFKAANLAESGSDNFVTAPSDTTNNGVTGFKVGQVISMAGGNSTGTVAGSYYIEAKEGICLTGQQNSVNLDAHQWEAESSLDTTIYDSTSSVELGAGTSGIDYTAAQGANSEITYYWRIRPNSADNAYWLGGVAFAVFQNISSAQPVGNSASLFTNPSTPNFLKDIAMQTASDANGGGANNMTRTYTVFRLVSPVLLHEFDEFKFAYSVRASGNDPTGAQNTTTWSGIAGLMLDQAWARGADGKMYLDIHNHATQGSELNVGVSETPNKPLGGNVGFTQTLT